VYLLPIGNWCRRLAPKHQMSCVVYIPNHVKQRTSVTRAACRDAFAATIRRTQDTDVIWYFLVLCKLTEICLLGHAQLNCVFLCPNGRKLRMAWTSFTTSLDSVCILWLCDISSTTLQQPRGFSLALYMSTIMRIRAHRSVSVYPSGHI